MKSVAASAEEGEQQHRPPVARLAAAAAATVARRIPSLEAESRGDLPRLSLSSSLGEEGKGRPTKLCRYPIFTLLLSWKVGREAACAHKKREEEVHAWRRGEEGGDGGLMWLPSLLLLPLEVETRRR